MAPPRRPPKRQRAPYRTPRTYVKITVTPAQAEEFCHRLAHDDDFRRDVQNDPRAMLAAYGVDISANLVPRTVRLPPKPVLQNILKTMQQPLFGGGSHAFVMICKVFPAFPLVTASEESDGAR